MQTLGKLSAANLKQMWLSTYSLDVSRFLPGHEVELNKVEPFGFYRFEPAEPGDDQFYKSLMRKMGYDDADKAEFGAAASEIGPGDEVLDVGCGTGNFATQCAGRYTGVETNPGAVEDAAKLGRNVKLGKVENLPRESFDVATVFQVLEHVPDPAAFMTAVIGRVRPGGKVVVSVPNQGGIVGCAANQLLNYPPHHLTWWSEDSLSGLLESLDCRVERVWTEPLQPLHYSVFLQALLAPADDRHISRSKRLLLTRIFAKILVPLLKRTWKEIPFVKGHTIMVVARKATA